MRDGGGSDADSAQAQGPGLTSKPGHPTENCPSCAAFIRRSTYLGYSRETLLGTLPAPTYVVVRHHCAADRRGAVAPNIACIRQRCNAPWKMVWVGSATKAYPLSFPSKVCACGKREPVSRKQCDEDDWVRRAGGITWEG